ncbi:MAG TPA: sigma-70 factor domain-containing protein [Acidimicrobiia bacterium]|nr:sigma-70 factor domain-containing protein [Acidimicrobiia bacterium]
MAKPVKARREDRDYEDLVRLYLEDVGRHELLTKDDEVRLAQAIEGGVAAAAELAAAKKLTPTQRRNLRRAIRHGEEAHRQFVNSNLRLVVSIAKK